MRITDRVGASILSAQVGDPLMIRFEIAEINSELDCLFVYWFFFKFLILLHNLSLSNQINPLCTQVHMRYLFENWLPSTDKTNLR